MISKQDCLAWLQTQPAESVDLLCTDPAYESLEKHRARGTTTRLMKDWFPIFKNENYLQLFTECFRVLRPNRHGYVFCDQETMFVIKPVLEQVGFKFWKPIIWDKMKMGMGYHYRNTYECILFFEKGKRNLKDLAVKDVLHCERVSNGYPTEKPVPLLATLIRNSTEPGFHVIDPFLGSGSTAVAALQNNCTFAGCDVNDAALAYAFPRILQTLSEARP